MILTWLSAYSARKWIIISFSILTSALLTNYKNIEFSCRRRVNCVISVRSGVQVFEENMSYLHFMQTKWKITTTPFVVNKEFCLNQANILNICFLTQILKTLWKQQNVIFVLFLHNDETKDILGNGRFNIILFKLFHKNTRNWNLNCVSSLLLITNNLISHTFLKATRKTHVFIFLINFHPIFSDHLSYGILMTSNYHFS